MHFGATRSTRVALFTHPWIVGANKVDHHARGAVLGRDFTPTAWAEIAVVEPGDERGRVALKLRQFLEGFDVYSAHLAVFLELCHGFRLFSSAHVSLRQ